MKLKHVPDSNEMESHAEKECAENGLSVPEILGWAEFYAWLAVVMTPIIWWLQGPSVSTGQYVMRTSLVVISSVLAISLRIWAIINACRVK